MPTPITNQEIVRHHYHRWRSIIQSIDLPKRSKRSLKKPREPAANLQTIQGTEKCNELHHESNWQNPVCKVVQVRGVLPQPCYKGEKGSGEGSRLTQTVGISSYQNNNNNNNR